MIRGVSRSSIAAVRGGVAETAAGLSSTDRVTLADHLTSVAALLTSQPRLRRALTDAAMSVNARGGLATQVLGNKIAPTAMAVTENAVRKEWAASWDLVDAIEQAADDVLLIDAEDSRRLGDVEDELFRFERILEAEPALTTLLDSATAPAERRIGLLNSLVADKVSPVTRRLLEQALRSGRTRGITMAISRLLDAATARQERSVARVISAVPLTDAQERRLATLLTRQFGRNISVRTAVEPAVQGGLVIRIGDEVIDGSVSSRLAAARKAVAG
jgi:F-type H+-transporting ATPase subunit delta